MCPFYFFTFVHRGCNQIRNINLVTLEPSRPVESFRLVVLFKPERTEPSSSEHSVFRNRKNDVTHRPAFLRTAEVYSTLEKNSFHIQFVNSSARPAQFRTRVSEHTQLGMNPARRCSLILGQMFASSRGGQTTRTPCSPAAAGSGPARGPGTQLRPGGAAGTVRFGVSCPVDCGHLFI